MYGLQVEEGRRSGRSFMCPKGSWPHLAGVTLPNVNLDYGINLSLKKKVNHLCALLTCVFFFQCDRSASVLTFLFFFSLT